MPLPRATSSRPDRSWSDDRLVSACLAGDAQAWDALLAKYKNLIYSIPIKYGASRDDANDIFQAVCLDLVNELPRLRRAESLPAWIATVSRHRSFHWKRGRVKRAAREGTDLDSADPAFLASEDRDLLQSAQHEQGVRDAIDRLPERCREMVRMLFFEQPPRPYAEVAAALGLAQGSIGFIRGRCLQKLQKLLEDAGYSR
jgi:RNA polymerase sigma factor (sigma-70 family)